MSGSLKVPKFKVGDKVKVLRASTVGERHLWGNTWVLPDMNRLIGKEYIIKYIYKTSRYNYTSYDIENWSVPEFVLQDTTIGKQLLFDFAKE